MATPTYDLIEEQVLGSATASVTFSSIPQTYTDLVLECVGANSTAADGTSLTFNGDTGTNYSRTIVAGDGTNATSSRSTSTTAIAAGYIGTDQSITVLHIMSYANTNVYKTVLGRGNSAGANVRAAVGLWRSTAAITSITLATANNMGVGTTYRLWGIA